MMPNTLTTAPTTFPALVDALAAAGYAPAPKAMITIKARCGRCFIFDVVTFAKEDTAITVLVKGAGATVAEALESARARVIG